MAGQVQVIPRDVRVREREFQHGQEFQFHMAVVVVLGHLHVLVAILE